MSVGSVSLDLIPISTVDEHKFIVGVETGVTGQRFRTKDVQSGNTLRAPNQGGFDNITLDQKEMHKNAWVTRADGFNMVNQVEGKFYDRFVHGVSVGDALFEAGTIERQLWRPYNGATVTNGGQFIHGATSESRTAVLNELITALAQVGLDGKGVHSNQTYGPTFNVATFTGGSGTSYQGNFSLAPSSVCIALSGKHTGTNVYNGFWLKFEDSTNSGITGYGPVAIDGVQTTSSQVLAPDNGWHFYSRNSTTSLGYTIGGIYTSIGSVVHIALEVALNAYVEPEIIFTKPIPPHNALI